jgi:predicted amidohydrolase YtcJ
MPSSERWLLRDVELDGRRVDCRIRDGVIVELAPGLEAGPTEQLLDAGGGALLPGLADHHLHLHAFAAAGSSLDLAGRPVTELADLEGPADPDAVVRIVGAATELRRADLDAVWPARPVRVQHRSGALWTLNSAALSLLTGPLSETERATGQFWRSSERLRRLLPRGASTVSLAAVSAQLAAYGITHVTDATPGDGRDFREMRQHVVSLAEDGTGPRKIVLPDHRPVDLDGLVRQIHAAHAAERGVALHAVTAVNLTLAIAALSIAGVSPADRIEHAAVCDDPTADRLAELGVTVVTQPTIFTRNGAVFRAEIDSGERDLLWRLGGLRRAGVRLAFSSDAPYGDPNPWETVRAAATRAPSPAAEPLGPPEERLNPKVALASLLASLHNPAGPIRAVAPGAPADLCLLDDSRRSALETAAVTGRNAVRATFVAGHRVHFAGWT